MDERVLLAPYINLYIQKYVIHQIKKHGSREKIVLISDELTIMNVSELLRNITSAIDSDKYGIIPPTKTIAVNTVAPKKSI